MKLEEYLEKIKKGDLKECGIKDNFPILMMFPYEKTKYVLSANNNFLKKEETNNYCEFEHKEIIMSARIKPAIIKDFNILSLTTPQNPIEEKHFRWQNKCMSFMFLYPYNKDSFLKVTTNIKNEKERVAIGLVSIVNSLTKEKIPFCLPQSTRYDGEKMMYLPLENVVYWPNKLNEYINKK